jgi:hypothetical protein
MRLTEKALRRRVRRELRLALKPEQITEEFDPQERDELSKIIRSEVADLFYDLFRKRSFWVS